MDDQYIFIEYKRAEFLRVYCSTKTEFDAKCHEHDGIKFSYFNSINDLLRCDYINSTDKEEAKYFFHKKGFIYIVTINDKHYFYNNNKDLMTSFECSVLYMNEICDLFKFFSVNQAQTWIDQEDYSQFPRFANGTKIYPIIKEIILNDR